MKTTMHTAGSKLYSELDSAFARSGIDVLSLNTWWRGNWWRLTPPAVPVASPWRTDS